MFPLEKYRYFTDNKKKVVAEQTYAGKKYRGIAVCDDLDDFNLETGKKIAALRCNLKICNARRKHALEELEELHELQLALMESIDATIEFANDATESYDEAETALQDFLDKNK